MMFLCENYSILESMVDCISKEPLIDMCYRIDKRIEDINSGYYDDLNKTEVENTESYINEIRNLRDEIEDTCENIVDITSKQRLKDTLSKVTHCLDKMKTKRNELGCGLVNYEDIIDSYKNDALYDILG